MVTGPLYKLIAAITNAIDDIHSQVDLSSIQVNVSDMSSNTFTDNDANIVYDYIGLNGVGAIDITPMNFGNSK